MHALFVVRNLEQQNKAAMAIFFEYYNDGRMNNDNNTRSRRHHQRATLDTAKCCGVVSSLLPSRLPENSGALQVAD